ncbi:bifunctional DNA primase/polymerase [Gordonia amicalis]|uniref:bifunctional DNA primase/polymerase n=1 Tax=Gordonia amicalis TaxID=89053 RepID=UPI0022B35A37|nr:bifunctional DNA primase/polymerase [Gordonia amicalis]MCZ4652700.1 bifunctional DNA primase/polymerase [Gordonia amicalis]
MLGDVDLDAAFDDVHDDDPDDTTDVDDVDTSTGYASAAQVYWAQGWRGILPLPRGKKYPPPKGYTGDGAGVPSYPDITAWVEDHADGNLALVLPDGVIGVDVDDYPGKRGGETLAKAEIDWGAMPPTVRSTSRDDGVSGIRLYRVPPGTRLQGQLTMGGTSDVEIVQRSHRYVVAYPSIHPNGSQYRWLDADGNEVGIPSVDDLPMLPERWVAELTAPTTTSTAGVAVDVPALLRSVPGGAMDAVVADRLGRAVVDLRAGGSRHDVAMRHALALLRLAEQGHPGVRDALTSLSTAFVDAVTADGSRSTASALAEFKRMLTNERGHALIAATPTVDFDELAEVAAAAPPPPPPPPPPPTASIPDDEGFWSSRPSLQAIYAAALGRMVAPWGVLGAVLVRAMATVPYTVHLPPLIGGPGSLNTFLALVAPSGGGKGATSAVAGELVPLPPEVGQVEVGSGEGLARQYLRAATATERKAGACDECGMVWMRRSVLYTASEVDSLAALGQRNAATLGAKLRATWSGEELGFAYAAIEKALRTGSHSYRAGLIVGVQPQRAGALLDEAAGGTPQRFVWVRVTDPRISRDRYDPTPITPLALPTGWPEGPWAMPVPDVAVDAVLDAHVARQRGEGEALDGHSLLCREKVMAALCVIDGRMEPNEEDWQLSGVVMAHSDAVRAEVAAELATADREAAAERGVLNGVERDAAAGSEYDTKLDRVCAGVLRVVDRLIAGGKPATEGAIGRLIASRDRSMTPAALEALILHGELTRDKATRTFARAGGGAA